MERINTWLRPRARAFLDLEQDALNERISASGIARAPGQEYAAEDITGLGETLESGRHSNPRWIKRVLSDPVLVIGIHLSPSLGEVGDVYYAPGAHLLPKGGRVTTTESEVAAQTPATQHGEVRVQNLDVLYGTYRCEVPRRRVTVYCSCASRREIDGSTWGSAGPQIRTDGG